MFNLLLWFYTLKRFKRSLNAITLSVKSSPLRGNPSHIRQETTARRKMTRRLRNHICTFYDKGSDTEHSLKHNKSNNRGMKKLFLAVACILGGQCIVQAQEIENADIVVLSKVTLDSLKSVNESNQTYFFDSSCKGITMTMGGRDPKLVIRQGFKDGLNFKNNTSYTINLPQGVSMYGVQFAGFSLGDNWCYLQSYGVDEKHLEWTDPMGDGVKDNNTIIGNAKYPMDPCVSTKGAPVFHEAGYTFASIPFTDDDGPYTGMFTFRFSGNNQEQALIRVFTSKSAWDKFSDQCAAISYGSTTGINDISTTRDGKDDGVMYNMLGQRIQTAKGLYIRNGKKFIAK